MSEYIHIGKLVAAHGVKGELLLKHALGKRTQLKGVEAVFIEEYKGSYLPYFLVSAEARTTDETVIVLEGVITRETAARLTRKNVWLPEEDFRLLVDTASPLSLLGFTLFNQGENLGKVEEVIEQPHQTLLRISVSNKEALIPLHEGTLEKIDRQQQNIHVVLPEGLLDIYL